jgi:hypothetical protein
MAEAPSLIRDPAAHLWAIAVRTAATRQFLFSDRCKANLREKLDSGLKMHKVGSYEFRERQTEAEENIKKLVGVMIDQELATTPDSRLLQESSVHGALYGQKLCPGLWPIC